MKTYHLGLLKDYKDSDNVILEIARTVDQLSCETWKYLGERETSFARLKRNAGIILAKINEAEQKDFRRLILRKIADNDFTAGH